MRWRNRRRSDNIEDRRGQSPTSHSSRGRSSNAALMRLLPMLLGRKGGKFGIIIVLLLFGASYFGVDLGMLTGGAPQNVSSGTSAPQQISAEDRQLGEFVSVVLADTEDTWHPIFRQLNRTYQEPKLVMFSKVVRSACGMAQSAMGPFYCPADQKVYIDLSFYRDLKERHGAPGDFAQAYVIAHEVGHHVQTLLGISQQVHQAKQRASKVQANELSVRQELQADCFAGIWANHADRLRNLLEVGDIEEALTAAAAIGDDRLQQRSRGFVTPDSFTHGSSEQRVRWFKQGYQNGTVTACDTFSAGSL